MNDQTLNISTMSGGSALVPSMGANYGMGNVPVTLPSIPNPTPPPPQMVTVLTPKAAKTDLASKQTTTNQIVAATSAQTQKNLLNTFGQPITQGGSPVPQAQPGQQPVQGQQQQGQTTTQPAAPTAATVPPAGAQPVTLPNGVTANYDTSTGQLSTQDGKQLQYIGGQWVDPATGQPPIAGGTQMKDAQGNISTQPGGIPSTGDPTSDYILGQLQQNQQAMDLASSQHQQQLNQVLNGTVPLTADQQAQVSGLQSQLQQLRTQQETANKNYVEATKLLGIRAGRMQYQPGAYAEDVNKAISDGVQKIADLDIQGASAVATLKQGFMDSDYKIINQSYQDLQNNIKDKSDTLSKMQNAVKTAVDTQTARLAQQSSELAIQSTQVNNLAQSALSATLKADGTLDLDMLQQIADEQGVDPNTLYSAVQKAQKDETLFQQGESKFASDQLQAKETLANIAANTANTYANLAKTQAETANLQPLNPANVSDEAKPLVSAFNSAMQGLPAAQMAQAKQTFNQLVNSGDIQGAKDFVIRVAASSLPTIEQTQVIGRSEALNALTDIQSLLDQAKVKSNDTGLVTGTLVNLSTKLGQNNDADLQYIGSRIQQQLQVYRRAMTGVAFSPQESQQYEKIFPDITNVNDLNTTKIQALADGLSGNNRADLEFAVGKSNYDQLFSPTPSQLPSDKAAATTQSPAVNAGSTVTYQGKQYTVDANGNMTAK